MRDLIRILLMGFFLGAVAWSVGESTAKSSFTMEIIK